MPPNIPRVENGYTANSLVTMNLRDEFGKRILEAKQIATTSNLPYGVLQLDMTIQALIRFVRKN